MSNSALVSYTLISPNKTSPRNKPIDRISIHCVVGQCSVETLGNIFKPTSRQASSNYGVGTDGRIGMYCEEKDRSWCTSSGANDHRAVTIEVASDTTAPYAVNDKAYAAMLDLVTDICKRNGKTKLLWFGDKDKTLAYTPAADEMVLTVHRWFANKSCPGDYLYNRHGEIAAEVTKRLSGTAAATTTTATENKTEDEQTATTLYRVQVGAYSKRENAEKELEKLKAAGYSAIIVEAAPATTNSTSTAAFAPYLVRINTDVLNIRKGASTNDAIVGNVKRNGVYTIVEESDGWGKLKSGAGWINLAYTVKV